MHFSLIDRVLEIDDHRVVAVKNVSAAEEYLQDHFPSFPVLPGVLMLEAMVQAARALLTRRDPALSRHVLGEVRALKYGSFVRPGQTLRVEVSLKKEADGDRFDFRGSARTIDPCQPDQQSPATAVSGRFILRPPSLGG